MGDAGRKALPPQKGAQASAFAEMRQNLEDYADDLREIIEKLRRKLDRPE
jgi:hypothetical protein